MQRRTNFDLEERTIVFAKRTLQYVKAHRRQIGNDIADQLSRSATSIAANYMEACVAESRKDFRHKCCLSAKEAKESWFWLRLISRDSDLEDVALVQEALELTKIFSSIKYACDRKQTSLV